MLAGFLSLRQSYAPKTAAGFYTLVGALIKAGVPTLQPTVADKQMEWAIVRPVQRRPRRKTGRSFHIVSPSMLPPYVTVILPTTPGKNSCDQWPAEKFFLPHLRPPDIPLGGGEVRQLAGNFFHSSSLHRANARW